MSSRSKKLALFALVILFSASALPQIYKWVDEEGNTHYGDTPPDGVEAEHVYVETRAPEHAPPDNAKMLQDAEARYRRLEDEREARVADRQALEQVELERDKRCAYLRKQLISLEQKLPVYRDEEGKFRTRSEYDAYEGTREYLDDATRAREVEGVQREIETTCDKPGDRGEQFMASWERMREKRCESARLILRDAQRDKRAPRQTIEDAQAEVDRYCASDK